jgi:hypothetical protein
MEIKTCEQYVINRVMKLETEVEGYKILANGQNEIIKELSDKLDFVKQFISIQQYTSESGEEISDYISFKSTWSKHEPDDFYKICDIFGLNYPVQEE